MADSHQPDDHSEALRPILDNFLIGLLKHSRNNLLSWEDPVPALDENLSETEAHITYTATVRDCINLQRRIMNEEGHPLPDETGLLFNFMATRWAWVVKNSTTTGDA